MPPSIASPAALRRQPSSPQSLPRVGSWQLVRLLGSGEWTEVYQARPEASGTNSPADYAVKVLRYPCLNESLAIQQLQREAFVASQVRHPHLVSVLSAYLDRSQPFLVLPYLSGATLRETLVGAGRLSTPHALWLVRQAAEALRALQQAGWRHGDVKPDNIFVAANGHATLLDLGFSQRIQGNSAENVAFVGSPAYAAPELFHGDASLSAASDVYSLGITLYELLTGSRPFREEDPAELAAAHLTKPAPEIRQTCPTLPVHFSRLIRQMLAKDPLRRPDLDELIPRLCELEVVTFDERVAG